VKSILETLESLGIIPVVQIENAENASPLAAALIAGGLPCAEITFRSSAAEEVIKQISQNYPDILVGAGTVLSVEQAKTAINAGAKFIVSPGFNPTVVKYCQDNNIPITPGISTPTEIEKAMEFGLEVVKFFPAEAIGGLNYLKAISAPYRQIKFIPTGGINQSNILSYLNFNKVHSCGGSWMVKADLISNKQFEQIKQLTRQAITEMLGFNLAHVGIDFFSEAEAREKAKFLADLLGFDLKEKQRSFSVSSQIEISKGKFSEKKCHLAIGTNFINRAIFYLEQRGIKTLPETNIEENGKLRSIYLDLQFGDYVIHLLQR